MKNSVKPDLVILAAGMASRYGSSKQTEAFGPSGETIMEYSIFDAIAAGFGRVIFIIREEFAEAFKAQVEPQLLGRVEIAYAYQDTQKHSGGKAIPAERVKPYGTQQALLCTLDIINKPFAVINADDYYGKDAFKQAYNFLTSAVSDKEFACIGYELKNTLSDHGSVTRGEIQADAAGNVVQITERKQIVKQDGKAISLQNDEALELAPETKVSMNFFCFTPAYVKWSEGLYHEFLNQNEGDLKAEFLIPEVVDQLIKSGEGQVKLIPTDAKWFGVTYVEDRPLVKEKLIELTEQGEYPMGLWADAIVEEA